MRWYLSIIVYLFLIFIQNNIVLAFNQVFNHGLSEDRVNLIDEFHMSDEDLVGIYRGNNDELLDKLISKMVNNKKKDSRVEIFKIPSRSPSKRNPSINDRVSDEEQGAGHYLFKIIIDEEEVNSFECPAGLIIQSLMNADPINSEKGIYKLFFRHEEPSKFSKPLYSIFQSIITNYIELEIVKESESIFFAEFTLLKGKFTEIQTFPEILLFFNPGPVTRTYQINLLEKL